MRNGVGVPQHIVLFGGTSEIGLAVLDGLLRPGVSRVTLVCRNVKSGESAADGLHGISDDTQDEIGRAHV